MTDTEIIKALGCCYKIDEWCSPEYQNECPIYGYKEEYCTNHLMKSALDLIERQKVEVEGYKESNREYAEMLAEQEVQIKMLQKENEAFAPLGKLYSEIKADAYKEFADRLKKKVHEDLFGYVEADVQNLLAELTKKGENE